jgi:pyruvate/2-oxoglutarate/acetoin dehydrogenase E1 component
VVFLEPRWLYQLEQEFETLDCPSEQPGPELVKSGDNVTVVSYGEGVLEAVKAAQALSAIGVTCEVIDLQILTNPSYELVIQSLRKTGHLLVIDPYSRTAGVGAEVVSQMAQLSPSVMTSLPVLLTPPFTPVPTALTLSETFYAPVRSQNIAVEIARMLGLKFMSKAESFEELHLPPKTKIGVNWEIL